jgi:NAD+ synthase (glutamine-hydrolysing)
MRICIAQTRVRAAALEQNFAIMCSAIEKAQRDESDIIVFPEMALPGYFLGDAWERPSFLQRCQDYVERIAALSNNIAVIFGSVGIDANSRNEDGRIRKYNAAFVAQNGTLLHNSSSNLPFWPKTLLPNYREFDDSRHFFDLRKLAIERNVSLENLLKPVALLKRDGSTVLVGIGLCEDAWDEDYSSKPYTILCQSEKRPDLLINLSCSPFTKGKQHKRRQLFSKKSNDLNLPIVYVNAVGSQNIGKTIFSFDGQSGVYSGDSFTPTAEAFVESVETISLTNRSTIPNASGSVASNQTDEIRLALESGLSFIRDEWGLEKVVIGVSGGIDSALSTVLHARVFGEKNITCINLPSKFNSQLTINAARSLATNINCSFASLSIEESVALTLRQLDEARLQGLPISTPLSTLVPENIQARDRGSRLIAGVASALGAIFPCNANKSEMTVGYSTLYGDHAGYLAPLGDLWKADVYDLSRHYNSVVYGREIIPSATLSVVPSAELSAQQDVTRGQGDPLYYPYHDALFKLWVEEWNRYDFESTLEAWENGTLSKILGTAAEQYLSNAFKTRDEFIKDLCRWWNAYVGMGAFKRVQAPPVLALTRRAFGFDHREAIGLHLARGK